jgi:hypothetical protein
MSKANQKQQQADPVNMDRVLFYETFEFLEDVLSDQLEAYAQLRQETHSFALQTFMLEDRCGMVRTTESLHIQEGEEKDKTQRIQEQKKEMLDEMRIPKHLLHHVTRIYDFYFGAESPMRFSVHTDIKREIQSEYLSGQTRVTWLDEAIQEILQSVYTEAFPGFVMALREIVDLFQIQSHALPLEKTTAEGHHFFSAEHCNIQRIASRVSLRYLNPDDGDISTVDLILAGYGDDASSSATMDNDHQLPFSLSMHRLTLPRYKSQVSLRNQSLDNIPIDDAKETSSLVRLSDLYKEIRAQSFCKRKFFKRPQVSKGVGESSPISPLTTQLYFDSAGLVLFEPV